MQQICLNQILISQPQVPAPQRHGFYFTAVRNTFSKTSTLTLDNLPSQGWLRGGSPCLNPWQQRSHGKGPARAAEGGRGRDKDAPSQGTSVLLGRFVFISVNRRENWALFATDLLFPTLYIMISVSPTSKGENKLSRRLEKHSGGQNSLF